MRNNSSCQWRYLTALSILTTLALLSGLLGVPSFHAQAATTITFTAEELLSRPTDTSININVIPQSAIELYYDYKVSGSATYSSTPTVSAAAGAPCNVVISGLAANTQYSYHMHYHLPGESDWVTRSEHSFHTQRAPGETFTFVVTSDTHAGLSGNFFSSANYVKTLNHILADQPDFMIDAGDTPKDDFLSGQAAYEDGYRQLRNHIKSVSGDVPFFQVLGNHEQEMGWNLDDEPDPYDTQPIQAANARRLIFPAPKPDGFYSGNLDTSLSYIHDDHLRADYYAWTWGDALFICLDPYWYTLKFPQEDSTYPFGGEENPSGEVRGTRWDWTLGIEQYLWLKDTLASSSAAYKFVFIHHVTGGILPYGRGGSEIAAYFEWGGKSWDDTWGWDTYRKNVDARWGDVPIHQLMDQYNVSIFFHGHDHFYAKQELDGIVYQEVPMPAGADGYWGFANEQTGTYASQYPDPSRILFYDGATKYPNSGHLRVTVAPAGVTVDYVDMLDGSITASYTVPAPATGYTLTANSDGHGTVTLSPSGGTYPPGTNVILIPVAETGYHFSSWSGPDGAEVSNTALGYSILMDGDKSVQANFVLDTAITHSIPLAAGWNLVSFNVHPANTAVASVLASVAGNYSLAFAWDSTVAGGQWLKYDPNGPAYQNSLSSLDETMGFWIKMNAAGTLAVSGSAPGTSSIALASGWNLAGYPSNSVLAMPGALTGHGVGDLLLVFAYQASDLSDPWKKHDPEAFTGNDLADLAPGWGFWVKLGAPHTWDVSY